MTNTLCRNEKIPLKAPKMIKLHSYMKDLCLYNSHEQVKLEWSQSQINFFKL